MHALKTTRTVRLLFVTFFLLALGVAAGGVSRLASPGPTPADMLHPAVAEVKPLPGQRYGVAADPDSNRAGTNQSREQANEILQRQQYWLRRLTYPTGIFDGTWLQAAATQD